MKWKREAPKKDGFYLHRECSQDFPKLVPIKVMNGDCYYFSGHFVSRTSKDGEWLGPVCGLYKDNKTNLTAKGT